MELKPSTFGVAVAFLWIGWALRASLSRWGKAQLKQINAKLNSIMSTQAELAVEVAAITPQVTAIKTGIAGLNTQIGNLNTRVAELEAALANAASVTPEVTAAVEALKTEVAATAALLPPPTPAPAPDVEPTIPAA